MKVLILTLILSLFSFNSYSKEEKLEFQYNFKDYSSFEKQFPFLINTDLAKGFKEDEEFAKENNLIHEISISNFKYKDNDYYLIINKNSKNCIDKKCPFKLFSKKENKIILSNYVSDEEIFINKSLIFFKTLQDIFYIEELEKTPFLNIKELNFDFKNYQNEREKILEMEKDNDIDKETQDETEIGIAYYDLNNDNKDEIIAKICNYTLYGNIGCRNIFYQIDNNGNYNSISIDTPFDLYITKNKTNGFLDIYSNEKMYCDIFNCSIAGNMILKLYIYNGEKYIPNKL